MLRSFDLREIKGIKKKYLIIFFDIILFNASFWISYNIRDDLFLIPTKNQFIHLLIGNFLFLFFYIYFEMNNFVTRYFDLDYIKSFIKFLSIFFLIYFSISFFYQMNGIPRSSPLIISLVYFSLVVVTRYLILNIFKYNDVKNKKKIVVIGDGEKAYNFYKSLSLNPNLEIVAFVSDNRAMLGRKIGNIEIISIDNIDQFDSNKISKAVIASNKISTKKIRIISNYFKKKNINIFFYNEQNLNFISSEIDVANTYINERDIDFFYKENSKIFKNSNILITGAGGSIGSELSKQICQFNPRKIILFENSEINLFNIINEVNRIKDKNTLVESVLGNINNLSFLKSIFVEHKPNIVFHAAAVKHVSIAEKNLFQCAETNIIGSKNVMTLSEEYKIKKFILISTDKAVKPSNYMGMTKRVAELMMLYFQKKTNNTSFCAVRFGNVANSSGSVFPIWQNQIKHSNKITITDPEATRYLMSISEAVNLVLDTTILSKNGEIFVLDMGKPKKIIELANYFLIQNGLKIKDEKNPDGDIEYDVIGLRPGEKKHEELFYENNFQKTINPYIFNSNEKIKIENFELTYFLEEFEQNIFKSDTKSLESSLKKIIFLNNCNYN